MEEIVEGHSDERDRAHFWHVNARYKRSATLRRIGAEVGNRAADACESVYLESTGKRKVLALVGNTITVGVRTETRCDVRRVDDAIVVAIHDVATEKGLHRLDVAGIHAPVTIEVRDRAIIVRRYLYVHARDRERKIVGIDIAIVVHVEVVPP